MWWPPGSRLAPAPGAGSRRGGGGWSPERDSCGAVDAQSGLGRPGGGRWRRGAASAAPGAPGTDSPGPSEPPAPSECLGIGVGVRQVYCSGGAASRKN